MGLAASQARLLSLTARMSDLELQGQMQSNQKQRLAVQSAQIADKYTAALNKQVLNFNGDSTNNANIRLSARTLANCGKDGNDLQRILVNSSGNVLVSDDDAQKLRDSKGDINAFLKSENIGVSTYSYTDPATKTKSDVTDPTKISNFDALQENANEAKVNLSALKITLSTDTAALTAAKAKLTTANAALGAAHSGDADYQAKADAVTAATAAVTDAQAKVDDDNQKISAEQTQLDSYNSQISATNITKTTTPTVNQDYYVRLFNEANNNGFFTAGTKYGDDSWLSDSVQRGDLTMKKFNTTQNKFVSEDWSSEDNNITQTTDSTDVAKAEGEYDAAMTQINSKDKRIDIELKNIDTEHQALQTEYDSVKKVIDKNIDRSFKIFNG